MVSEASHRTVGRQRPGWTTASPRATSVVLDADEVERDAVAGPDALGALVEALDGPDAGRPGVRTDDDLVAHRRARRRSACRSRPSRCPSPRTRGRPTGGAGRGRRPPAWRRPARRGLGARSSSPAPVTLRPARSARRPGTCPRRGRPRRAWPARATRRRRASTLVRATTPWPMPSSSRMRRCSSLCGFHPSVAATTNRQASTAPTPASMFVRKRTWPGTSTKLIASPDGQRGVGEAEVDRQPPPLLLLEPVGVGPGEGQHERRLAVVDVPGGGDDPHGRAGDRAASAVVSVASSPGSTVRRSR